LAIVDLRSDTFTMPSPEMRAAMNSAELGDDVWGEDPTINRLQEVAAERLGKEAALFVSSGTMGNLLGILVSARAGQEIIADADSHTFLSEVGGAAALGGIQIMPVKTEAGIITPEQVADSLLAQGGRDSALPQSEPLLAALSPRFGGTHTGGAGGLATTSDLALSSALINTARASTAWSAARYCLLSRWTASTPVGSVGGTP
jgi:threonine aldolase